MLEYLLNCGGNLERKYKKEHLSVRAGSVGVELSRECPLGKKLPDDVNGEIDLLGC